MGWKSDIQSYCKKSAIEYVKNTYADLDLEVENCVYNFKFSSYMVFFTSPTSEDTAFSVFCDDFGEIVRDDYPYEVENNFTTWRRIDSKLCEIGKNLIYENLSYNIENAGLTLENMSEEYMLTKLSRDMEFDINNPQFNIGAFIYIDDIEVSYEKMAEIMIELGSLFNKENISVSTYSISIKKDTLISTDEYGNEARENKMINIYDIPSELLLSDDLASELEKLD